MSDLIETASAWLRRDPDPGTQEKLRYFLATENTTELERSFSARMAFGTAGLRGLVGVGPACMNKLVVRETTAGLGRYLLDTVSNARQRGVVITYDARPDSEAFASDTACTLAAMGFTTWLTASAQPTPIGAFAVRHLRCAAGVVITASHNPPAYNGYKVYWENGAQIIPPMDAGIAAAIDETTTGELPWIEPQEALTSGHLKILEDDFESIYLDTIASDPLFQNPAVAEGISIAYTPLHGVGAKLAESLLGRAGYTTFSEPSQREPDGLFPTVEFPNPEEHGAMDAVLALAESRQATLACANDPDADRLAVAVRDEQGAYQQLTGDMVGALLGDYLLRQKRDFTPITCTTIVSSRLLGKLAAAAGAQHHETLTGFKWLANTALSAEDANHKFLFAYEEALGYACGRNVLDKDGLSALLAIAHLAAELAAEGRSLLHRLEDIYRRHGIHLSAQVSLQLSPGAPALGDKLRHQPPIAIAGQNVVTRDDLATGTRHNTGAAEESLGLPHSDVLIYHLAGDARVIVRPSGTEPKLKCYYEVVEHCGEGDYRATHDRAEAHLRRLVDLHQSELAAVLRR